MKFNTILVVFILFFILLVSLVGCIESDQENTIPRYKKEIVGMWYNQGTMENDTYAIVYEFFSNMSFYSALIDFNNSVAINAIRGTYDIDNDTIYFSDTNMPVSPEITYVFEDDYLNLLMYFPDNEKPIVFAKDI